MPASVTSTADSTCAVAMLRLVDHLVQSTPDLDEGIRLPRKLGYRANSTATSGGPTMCYKTRAAVLVGYTHGPYIPFLVHQGTTVIARQPK